ncbi:MAG: diguanylate cyclase domain-containing protein [Acidimicrobiales bacterium]
MTREATLAALEELVRRHELRAGGGRAEDGARPGPGPGAGAGAGAGAGTGPSSAAHPTGSARRRGGGGHRGVAVLLIQVDGLDALNEHRGAAAGDELLALMALRIVDSVRASDMVGRVGDDEFAILCGGVPGPTTALTIGRSTFEQVSQPMELRTSGTFAVRASMGVSWTDQVAPAEALLDRARAAAVSSKLDGATEPVLASAGTSSR